MNAKPVAATIAGALSLLIVGCASSSATRTGSKSYAALPSSAEVTVYATEKDVKEPFETLGIVEYSNPGKYQILTLDSALPALKEKARSLGANGIIVDQTQATKSGIFSTGVSVRARAIRANVPQ